MKSRSIAIPLLVLIAVAIALVADVLMTAPQLPERPATHFDASGRANGWMTRGTHMGFTLGFGLGVPLFMLLLSAGIGWRGGKGLNIPNRAYWLAPERRAETLASVQGKVIWFACLLVLLFVGINHTILIANTHAPAHLPDDQFWWITAPFLAATIIWVTSLILPFLRKA